MKKKEAQELTYESAQVELQAILDDMQSEVVSIDTLGDKVQRAKELLEFCREKLRKTEEQVRKDDNKS